MTVLSSRLLRWVPFETISDLVADGENPICHLVGRKVRPRAMVTRPRAQGSTHARYALYMADTRINRKLAAILAADVVGYSRLMGADEPGTLAALKRHRETIFNPAVAAHNGRVVKLMGDGVIVE